MNFSNNVSFASLPLFLPTIVSEMGSFTTVESNGLLAPPYFLCFLLIIAISILSDRVCLRGPFAAFFAFLSAVGFILLGATTSVTSRYVGTFFAVLIFVTTSIVLIWNANTNSTSSKRAGGLWIIMTVGQCGPLLGTNVFPSNQSPLYREGSWICCAFALLSGVTALVLSFCLWQENEKMDRLHGPLKELDPVERPQNDGIPRFRYII
ncbi:hypothetical protein F66182_9699 [Fusarium sp. NRRL 66182]|nr:hypothetical protein F66182_9699 [Fusarium sp. NRRL 66182]